MKPGFYWVSAPAKYRPIEERSIKVGHPIERQPAFFDGKKWWFIGGLVTVTASLFKRLDYKVLGPIENWE